MPGRPFGRRLRTGRYSTTLSTVSRIAASVCSAISAFSVSLTVLVLAERGWPTLQLSR
ncbi:hypothetical protein SVIOM342S_09619 [Streptomyces violaceorubidus]